MFAKSRIGISREHNNDVKIVIEGSEQEVLTLLATLNGKTLSQLATKPSRYNEISKYLQVATLKAYSNFIKES